MATELRAVLSTSSVRLAPLFAVATLSLLGLLYVALFAQAVTLPVDSRFANSRGSFAGGDFVLFYSAGRLAAQGEAAAAYDLTRYRSAHAEVMDAETPRAPWIYPPTTLLALRALGHLPPIEALWTWLALSALAGAGAAAIVGGWRLAPLGLLYPGIGQALVCGQNGAFSAPGDAQRLAVPVLVNEDSNLVWLIGADEVMRHPVELAEAPRVVARRSGQGR